MPRMTVWRIAPYLTSALLCCALPAAAQDAPVGELAEPVLDAALRDLTTDRPDKTESPATVDPGHVQIELDVATWTRDRDRSGGGNVLTRTVNIAPVNLKLGIAPRTDVQLIFDSYIRQTVDDREAGTRQRSEGVGDVKLRLKRNFWGNDGGPTAFGVMPFVKLPTNTGGLGNRHVEGGIIAPLAMTVTDRIGIGLMTEIDLLRRADGAGYAPTFINSVTVGSDLTDRLGLYGEVYTERSTERGARTVVTADAGMTFAIGDNLQLDTGVNVGVTDAADDLMLFVGISRRF